MKNTVSPHSPAFAFACAKAENKRSGLRALQDMARRASLRICNSSGLRQGEKPLRLVKKNGEVKMVANVETTFDANFFHLVPNMESEATSALALECHKPLVWNYFQGKLDYKPTLRANVHLALFRLACGAANKVLARFAKTRPCDLFTLALEAENKGETETAALLWNDTNAKLAGRATDEELRKFQTINNAVNAFFGETSAKARKLRRLFRDYVRQGRITKASRNWKREAEKLREDITLALSSQGLEAERFFPKIARTRQRFVKREVITV